MNKLAKILVPELEIFEATKSEGFIRKGSPTSSNSAMTSSVVTSAGMRMPETNVVSSKSNPSVNASAGSELSSSYSTDTAVKNVDDKFNGIEKELGERWVGDDENINELVLAFKRPFVMGVTNSVPANNILICGQNSSGKRTAVINIASLLKQNKILKHEQVSSLDMAKYQSKDDENIFMTDLYQALYTPTDIVIFENIERAGFSFAQVIIELMKTGNFDMHNRYINNFTSLVQSTGTLNTNSISKLEANGKYFVFLTTLPQEKFAEKLRNDFMRMIGDIISLKELSEKNINRLVYNSLLQLGNKIEKNLHINVTFDETVRIALGDKYSAETGVAGLLDYIVQNIYKPIAGYKLKNIIKDNAKGTVVFENEIFNLNVNNQIYSLNENSSNYDALAIEQVKSELNDIVGLQSVKDYVLSLEKNLNVQKLRTAKGLKTADVSMHMIFTGNPGTGKTTIARIVAKYLKALGILSSGQLIEVTRSDLVGMYVGQTAQLTANAIKSAIGGVLFIDEAYSLCRDKNDVFGLEAVDALVKGMEDNRDNLVVIIAGYTKEMADFIENNPGLKSRFPNTIEFPDYSSEEMYKIALITAKQKGYKIDENLHDDLIEAFDKKQIKGRNDSGNGRLVRNMIEAAIVKQSDRISGNSNADMEQLTADDFGFTEKKEFNLDERLSSIIGLTEVKDFVKNQYAMVLANEKRKKADIAVDTTESMNMIFMGNPGTGKTTIARVVAEMFHEMGVLKSGQLVETDKGGLIGQYQGETVKKTEKVFRSALGGVLFIDEAYSLTNDHSSYGQECVDTLVKLIEDYRGEILVILAGYTKEMSEFLKANSGLESRFPLKIEFPDYSSEELYQIGLNMADKKGFKFSDEAKEEFHRQIGILKSHSDAASGNGRMVRNYLEEIIRTQSSRIASADVSSDEMNLILPEDLKEKTDRNEKFDLEKELSNIIGLENVKDYVRSLNAKLLIQEKRKEAGLKVDDSQTLHMIFKGNPGTGKTMMARTIANALANLGVIRTNKLVETDRSGLVAGYVGQTAIKTRQVIESSLDGVLFVDEAYSLSQGGANDFGKEAIDTMVKMMDDNRDRLVIILAGYSDDMDTFLEQNAGLKSRFANIIEFPDYTPSQLMQICELMYKGKGYILSPGARAALEDNFKNAVNEKDFGNGRYVRNLVEKSINNQSLRLSGEKELGKDKLVTIEEDDIRRAKE